MYVYKTRWDGIASLSDVPRCATDAPRPKLGVEAKRFGRLPSRRGIAEGIPGRETQRAAPSLPSSCCPHSRRHEQCACVKAWAAATMLQSRLVSGHVAWSQRAPCSWKRATQTHICMYA
eukprot:CAMPEP_0195069282 /NCGR_PEP_ID=MMETSP0448-20130528/13614_1 /TAXON_ID=66468 /ORGANISM="Heterocapsa triquestra, Strain CCMP 448" /LENGTH=118 /DNA_ID=CAMNT_0040100849 /DNA_START=155 /DNA_END=508 /DNA_ORIENTATION=-